MDTAEQQSIRDSSIIFNTLLEISSDVIWSFDFRQNKYSWWVSEENKRKYGIPEEEVSNFWGDNLLEDDRQLTMEGYQQALYDPNVAIYEHEYRFSGANNVIYFIRDKMKFIRDNGGVATLVIGVWRDITSEKDRERFLEAAFLKQKTLNDELAIREESLLVTKEELRQTNEQLLINLQQLSEREFILNCSQRLAKIGSWEYEYSNGKCFWSDEMFNIYGVDKHADITDMENLLPLFEEGSRTIVNDVYQRMLKKLNEPFDITVQIVTPLGYKKWLRIAGYNMGGHYPERMIGISYDITYFKESEQRLKASEEKFSKAFNNNPDPMMIIRKEDLVIMDINNKALPVLGYTLQDVVNQSFLSFDFFENQNDRLEFFENWRDLVYKEFECVWKKKNQEEINVLISSSAVEIQEVKYFILVVKDISARKAAERKLRMSEANLKATINNTNVMVWSVDRDLKYVMMNKPFINHIKTTYDFDVAPGIGLAADVPDESTARLQKKWQHLYKRALSGETFSISEERSGRYLDYSLSPIIENGKVMGVSVFAEDVTEKTEQKKELIQAQNAIAEYKLIALRSVMNPHFIFNALNSIQFFIAKNDRLNAINYLSTFSKLIRGILNTSVSNKIKLTEELELLKHYIDLELIRFERKFEYILNVDPLLDIDNIEIQSLIIQPFVENAILHGLYNSETNGILKISVEGQGEEMIMFTIEDNGIGRKAARKLQQQNHPAHKSVGISVTEERLKLINNQKQISVEIKDLYQDGKPAGTKVTICVRV